MTSTDHTQKARAQTGPRILSPKKIAAYAGLAALSCILVCLFFPGVFINPFLEGRITEAFGEAYPSHRIRIAGLDYNFWKNRLVCDSVRVIAADSAPVFSATGLTVTGVSRLPLLLGGGVTPDRLGDAHAEARDVILTFTQSQHELRCALLRISMPDSSATIEGLRYQPRAGDEGFFAGSAYRKTRYRLVVPRVGVAGLVWVMPGDGYRARAIRVEDASLSVLIDKEKPSNTTAANPRMPAEILASLGGSLYIDSVKVVNGRMSYEERFDAGSDPAVLTFDGIQMTAEGVGNTAGRADTVVVRARGILMGAGAMTGRLSMPVASPELSFRCSGSLGAMEFARFNPFVEVSEGFRLKTGTLHSAAFELDVTAGKAGGAARVVYNDLKIVAIEKRSGSESGIVNTFVSLIANNVKLRTTNMPDGSDSMKVGTVRYDRKRSETFLEFAWLALRSGIGDVVGL